MRTYKEIKKAVEGKKYVFFKGNLDLNMIWERTSDNITNHFTDFLHVVYLDNGFEKVLSIPATTMAGIKGAFDSPKTVAGYTGTAVIKEGQYIKAWQFRDTFDEFLKYPYFRQVGPIDYFRDGNKDLKVDHVQEQQDKVFGTHWHRMSKINAVGNLEVNNWSEGCFGAMENDFEKIFPIVRASVKLYGDLFTGTIINSSDFL